MNDVERLKQTIGDMIVLYDANFRMAERCFAEVYNDIDKMKKKNRKLSACIFLQTAVIAMMAKKVMSQDLKIQKIKDEMAELKGE